KASSSSESESASEDEPPKKAVAVRKPVVKTGVAGKAAAMSRKASSSSESESDSEDEPPNKAVAMMKPVVKTGVAGKAAAMLKKASSSSESESDSEDESPKKAESMAKPVVKGKVTASSGSSAVANEIRRTVKRPLSVSQLDSHTGKKFRADSMGSSIDRQFAAKNQTSFASRSTLGGDDGTAAVASKPKSPSVANLSQRKRRASHNATNDSEEPAPPSKKPVNTAIIQNGSTKKPKLNASGDTNFSFNVSSLPNAASTPAQGAAALKKPPRHSLPALSNGAKNSVDAKPPSSAPRQPFRRVPDDCVTVNPHLVDNSFAAKYAEWLQSALLAFRIV
ncbi:unnamed protein product, partial [Schistocephalus solidus]|uniref:Nucleolar and coiled-body phosphoprotein 1 n=1 Tax=Schistocephalus solidus TaxID=70667 RepID=A0A183SAP6_SCHSO